MKKMLMVVFMVLLFAVYPACGIAGPVTAEWDLSVDDQYLGATGGYRLYVGVTPGVYTTTYEAKAGATSLVFTVPPGSYVAAMSAFDSRGLEGIKTDEVPFNVVPGRPSRLRFR